MHGLTPQLRDNGYVLFQTTAVGSKTRRVPRARGGGDKECDDAPLLCLLSICFQTFSQSIHLQRVIICPYYVHPAARPKRLVHFVLKTTNTDDITVTDKPFIVVLCAFTSLAFTVKLR